MEKLAFAWAKFLYYWAFPPVKIGTGIFVMCFSLFYFFLRDGSPTTFLIILLIGMGIFIHGLVAGTPGIGSSGSTGTISPPASTTSTPALNGNLVSQTSPSGN